MEMWSIILRPPPIATEPPRAHLAGDGRVFPARGTAPSAPRRTAVGGIRAMDHAGDIRTAAARSQSPHGREVE